MNKNIIDLTGKRFGRLVVSEIAGKSKDKRIVWLCKCDCGNEKIIRGHDLKTGKIKSCGCVRYVCGGVARPKTSGKPRAEKKLYGVWANIVQRCENPNNHAYPRYGGRGISICSEWRHEFDAFERWALDTGYFESEKRGQCTIERKDNNGNYCPENCVWATNKEQSNNRRSNRILEYNGEKKTLTEWAEILGIPHQVIRDRLFKLGWSVDRALSTPAKKFNRRKGADCKLGDL